MSSPAAPREKSDARRTPSYRLGENGLGRAVDDVHWRNAGRSSTGGAPRSRRRWRRHPFRLGVADDAKPDAVNLHRPTPPTMASLATPRLPPSRTISNTPSPWDRPWSVLSAARRKTPSGRSIQRYCDEGHLAAKKIRTIFGSEWLINETSLAKFIEAEPIVTGDASDAIGSDMATSATPTPPPLRIQEPDTIDNGDASDAMRPPMATPKGETRTIAEVLIENARLLAQVEGRDAIIDELKEDRTLFARGGARGSPNTRRR